MTLQTATEAIKKKVLAPHGLRNKFLFDFGAEGQIYIDTTTSPALVANEAAGPADLTLQCTLATFEGFLTGTKDPNVAFMTRQLKIQGPIALAMRLNSFLED